MQPVTIEQQDSYVLNKKYSQSIFIGSVTDKMLTPACWISEEDAGQVLMPQEEIFQYNKELLQEVETLVDIFSIDDHVSGKYIAGIIEQYDLREDYYLDGILITDNQIQKLLKNMQFVVILEPMYVSLPVGNRYLAMGLKLPYTVSDGKLYVKLPNAVNIGQQIERFFHVELQEGTFHVGYLPFTRAQLLNQATKLINTPYGWGGKGEETGDCSSTMLSVYNCFGIHLPRNTWDMSKITQHRYTLMDRSNDDKINILMECNPGTLILMKGHVMMLLGVKNDQVFALHNFTKYFDSKRERIDINRCLVTPLDMF